MSRRQESGRLNDVTRLPPVRAQHPPLVTTFSCHVPFYDPSASHISSAYDGSVPSIATRSRLLTPKVQGMSPTWLERLQSTFRESRVTIPPWPMLYPLEHHQELIQNWRSANPGQLHPAEERWGLMALKGGVEDDCHPRCPPLILVFAALNGSPSGQLTSKEVRLALMVRYNFFITGKREWHDMIDSMMASHPQYFKPNRRIPNSDDDGCYWSLTSRIRSTYGARSSTNFYQPLLPVHPTRRSMSDDALIDIERYVPEVLDVDLIKGIDSPIPREVRNELMKAKGRLLIDEHLRK